MAIGERKARMDAAEPYVMTERRQRDERAAKLVEAERDRLRQECYRQSSLNREASHAFGVSADVLTRLAEQIRQSARR